MNARRFTDPLDVRLLDTERDGLGEFETLHPFTYDVGYFGSGQSVTVPAGYVTDFASIPRWARGHVPITGRGAKAALLHDWLLDQDDPRANDVFAEALTLAGVPWLRRTAMVAAVKVYWRWKRLWT